MPKLTVAGHPLHPQLIVAPAGLLPFSFVMDLLHLTTKKKSYAEAAYYTMVGGSVGAMAAASAGLADYLTIPRGSKVRQNANMHATMNAGLLVLYVLNLLLRRGKNPPAGALPAALSAIGATGLLVSQWYGGEMVYEQGMRVKGVSPVARADEWKPPYDDELADAFDRGSDVLPAW